MTKSASLITFICCSSFALFAELTPIQLIESVQPPYPEVLKIKGDDGAVKIRTRVDETGKVTEVSVVSASHEAFGEAAMEAIKQWHFKPAEKDGVPVSQTINIPIIFKLSPKDRINAKAGRDVFVNIEEMTDKVYTWADVKKYFGVRGKLTRFMPYPESLKGSGISEEITFQCIISPDGMALNPTIVNLDHKELAIPAIEHLAALRFNRPNIDGEPIFLQQKVKIVCSEDPKFGVKK